MANNCGIIGAGDLREVVTIQTYLDGKDSIGIPIVDWSNLTTIMAKVEYADGDEIDKVTKEVNETQVNFYIRTIENLNTKMRIVYNTEVFDIRGILKKGNRLQFSKVLTVLIE